MAIEWRHIWSQVLEGGDMGNEVNDESAMALVHMARDCLATGDDKRAARLLTDAAYQTHNPEIEQQVRQIAAHRLESVGHFRRGRWAEIIRIADTRTAQSFLD
jgi:hypothetical protein